MQHSLVMTIIGEDRPGLVESVADIVTGHGGNWLESRFLGPGLIRAAGGRRTTRLGNGRPLWLSRPLWIIGRIHSLCVMFSRRIRGVVPVRGGFLWTSARFVYNRRFGAMGDGAFRQNG